MKACQPSVDTSTMTLSPEERIKLASELAYRYGGIDGAHHKQWLIDQMLQAILGNKGYQAWVTAYSAELGYEESPWDTGIAP